MFCRLSILCLLKCITENIQVNEGHNTFRERHMLNSPDLRNHSSITNITTCDCPRINCPSKNAIKWHVPPHTLFILKYQKRTYNGHRDVIRSHKRHSDMGHKVGSYWVTAVRMRW